jgi:hypothetical protein
VIYLVHPEGQWEIFHDFRLLADLESEPPVFLAMKLEKPTKKMGLYILRDCHDDKLQSPFFVSASLKSHESKNLLEKVEDLLKEKGFLSEMEETIQDEEMIERSNCPLIFAEKAKELSEKWKLSKNVLLVSHTRCLKKDLSERLIDCLLFHLNAIFQFSQEYLSGKKTMRIV